MISISEVSGIEQRLFYYLCIFSISLPLSKAVANISLAIAVVAFIHRLFRRRDDIFEILSANRNIFFVTAALMTAVLLSAFSSGFIEEGLISYSHKYIAHIATLFPVLVFCGQDKIKIFMKLLIVGAVISNLSVIVQAVPNIDQEFWRFGGVLATMTQGSLLTMFMPIYILLLIHFRNSKYRWLFLSITIIGFAATLFNGTRGAWVSLSILIPAVILLYSKEKIKASLAMLAIIITVGGIFFTTPQLSERVVSITDMNLQQNAERFKMWQSAFNMFKDHPLLGVGYGQYKKAYQTQYILPEANEPNLEHAHNNVMQMLGECGLIGLSAFLLMWSYFTYFCLRGWFKERDISYLMFFCILWGMMLHGITEFNFETSIISKLLWYSLGLLLCTTTKKSSTD